MKLTIFNGSPKKGISNTEVMVNKFIDGLTETKGNNWSSYKLYNFKNLNEAVKILEKSEYILIAFPLYNYSMPSGVKRFIELLEPYCKTNKLSDKKIGFLVQYGFPEAIHARALEKYLVNLCKLLKSEYLGTIIKGGCNNVADGNGPKKIIKKILEGIYIIGKKFGEDKILDKSILNEYSKPEKSSILLKLIIRIMVKLINKHYWKAELEKNGALENSFARPYQE